MIEYLKGEGGGEVVGIVYGQDYYESRVGAFAFGADLTETHDTTWDDGEAIVFMNRRQSIVSTTEQPDRYVLGFADYGDFGSDSYTIESIHAKRWLPAGFRGGEVNEVASGALAGGNDEGELRFLTGAERAEGESRTEMTDYRVANSARNEALGAGGDSSAITVSQLKNVIAELQEEVAEGDGSEEYRECVLYKYSRNREVEYNYLASDGVTYDTISYDHKLASGSPANTVFALGTSPFQITEPFVSSGIYVTDIEGVTWLEGKDAHLFHAVDNKLLIGNVRPLSEGEYRFYLNGLESRYIPCNAYPDRLRTSDELVVDVIAPEGTLHEAFFDPADISGAIGADSDNGVLNPNSFETDSGGILIERIEWRDGQVEMKTSLPADLSDRRMDFIVLDGSVSLRLDFDDATQIEEAGTSTLTWSVCDQPWQDGDLLMLRIAEGIPDDGVVITNDSEC